MQPGERLGELAGHWAAAVGGSDAAKAAHYAGRAGERALQQLAPDEAARWYRQALELQEQAHGADGDERCELLIGLGEAQRQIGDAESRETLLDAAAARRDDRRQRPAVPRGARERPRLDEIRCARR